MKNNVIILLIAFLLNLTSFSQNISGVYNTDYNEMTLSINGNNVTGTYKHSDGKISGVLTGSKLIGKWSQTNGKGNIEFIFNSDFSAFAGKWAYNNNTPSNKWNGTKISSTNTSVYKDIVGSSFSGIAKSSKSGKSWATSIKIISYNPSSGFVEGQIEWPSLSSVHKIEGKLINSQFTFKEVAYIKKGNANLNCQYTTTISGNKIFGTWTDPSSDKGAIELNNKDNVSNNNSNNNNNPETQDPDETNNLPTQLNSYNSKIAGTYNTDFNEMTLSINGNSVTGTYKHNDGKINGVLEGNKLIGNWTQTNGKGKFEFLFNSEFSAFTGKWAYNNNTPSNKWNGTKISSTNTSVYKDIVGSSFSGIAKSSKSGKSWATSIKIISYNPSSGFVEGQIEWPSLSSVHKIEGKLINSQFTFKEIAYIKKGNANLNCQYTTTISGNKIFGTWTDPSSDKGTIELTNKNDTKISDTPELVETTAIPNKSGFPDPNTKSPSGETLLPVNIIGSWAPYGNIKRMGRMSFWQKR